DENAVHQVDRAKSTGGGVRLMSVNLVASEADPRELIGRAQSLMRRPGLRRILGITGLPGSGKSTLAGKLAAALAPHAIAVPMDGFHLARSELARLGRRDRKGAIDTFDGHGYLSLLHRLRDPDEDIVYAPEYRRDIGDPIASAI